MRRAALLAALLTLLPLTACGSAQGLGLKRIGSFDSPAYVTGAPGFPKLLFVVEQPGRVVVLRGGHRVRRPFLNIKDLVSYGGERGLLSIGFPPDYSQSGRLYVYYTDDAGDIRVDEFHRRSATRAARGSRRTVIRIPHPFNSNHNGGQLQFLGQLLYFATGDGGSAGDPPNNAQSKESLLGNYVVTGTETNGKSYDGSGPLVITMDKNGALELKWDNGKYVGIGQVVGDKLAIASSAEGRVIIGVMEVRPDGSLAGKYWRRTDAGTGGTEVWVKK